jgi:hypothetical protein
MPYAYSIRTMSPDPVSAIPAIPAIRTSPTEAIVPLIAAPIPAGTIPAVIVPTIVAVA